MSALDPIRERRQRKPSAGKTSTKSLPKKPDIPNVLEILEDRDRVKRRLVTRSEEDVATLTLLPLEQRPLKKK